LRTVGASIDRMLIRRNLNLASGSVIAPLDFASAEAFAPQAGTVTLANLGGDNATVSTYFQTQNGGSALLGSTTTSNATDRAVIGVPSANFVGTDRHLINAVATSFDASSMRSVFT